jgi:outer membrane protein assembly factor BamB
VSLAEVHDGALWELSILSKRLVNKDRKEVDMKTIQRRLHLGHLGIIAAMMCIPLLIGCASVVGGQGDSLANIMQTCYPQSTPVPGPIVFRPMPGQTGLYAFAGPGIYRFGTAGSHLTPIWLYRMHECVVLTPTIVPHLNGPSYEQPNISSGLTVAKGMVYFSAYEKIGSWVDLYAVHADTGSLAWKVRVTDASGIGGLLVLHDLIYIETGDAVHSSPPVNIISALSVRDGSVRWTYRYPLTTTDTGMGLSSAGDGAVYVTGSNPLFALNATTGKQMWQANLPQDQGNAVSSLLDGVLYVTSSASCFNCEIQPSSSLVSAFDPATGTQLWQSQRLAGFLTPPLEARGIVYVGSQDGHLHALRASDGMQLWTSYAGGELHVTPQVINGLVCVGTAPFLGKDDPNTTATHIIAFDATSGHQQWSYTVPPTQSSGYEPILSGNGTLYTTSGDKRIDILQATTGKLLQQYSVLMSGPDLGLALAP